ncbi:short chain dehydrogenase/reductase family protein-like protein [Dothidotthia symphoricarpi CBS 119687]|uniref:Short-chain dehydrogenase/reductase 3 n=1 Tax=Dothidotthia symphoricarpi CBS 119687 TaxID=1392245 RepID=A0A6A6AUR6_9PLEO|nr:short chain dehydrogenase/reductase family protein-like protein [Dothidotthia symphoricarpi CBS 119687]KAF2134617.1 short chain dehydrogenase/reductase family protein-like protein [Dothidotthia symphoricarpi CBS 119687]
MPIRSEYSLAREGITGDTLARLIHHTALNPALTLPLLALAHATAPGKALTSAHPRAVKSVVALAGLGLLKRVSAWLDGRVVDNWTADGFQWEKEVVVVTGGSEGIGMRVVGLLAERGVKVAVLDVRGLGYEAPPSVSFFHCDLSSPSSIATAADAIRAQLGDPTVLINNAGVARGKTILDTLEKDINLTFRVNTFSHYFLAQQFLPAMIRANHGMVVTIASLAGYITAPSMVDYAASKAAAVSFHEGLAAELVTHYDAPKVRTVLVTQGYTRTALFEGFGGKALYPETVAEAIVRAVFRGRSDSLCLPETSWLVAPKLRAMPQWVQYALRRRLMMMQGWKGRQVAQPSEEKVEEKEKDVEDSTVLVDGE